MSDHGLTPVRPRTTPLEATILDELRELRERVAKLEAKRNERPVRGLAGEDGDFGVGAHDPLARYRWRCALVRAGRGAEAGFEEGDEVSVACADRVPLTRRFKCNLFMGLFDLVAVGKLMGEVCKHNKAWTLLKPAKPKGGEA